MVRKPGDNFIPPARQDPFNPSLKRKFAYLETSSAPLPSNHLCLASSPTLSCLRHTNCTMPDYSCPTSFSDESLDCYLPDGITSNQYSSVPDAGVPNDGLIELITKYAPHLCESFALTPRWWEKAWGTPEAHVRSIIQDYS